jgi:hypothetical protein
MRVLILAFTLHCCAGLRRSGRTNDPKDVHRCAELGDRPGKMTRAVLKSLSLVEDYD